MLKTQREIEIIKEQKRRRRESKKNAIAEHKAYIKNNPVKYMEKRSSILSNIVDMLTQSKYPLYQFKLAIS